LGGKKKEGAEGEYATWSSERALNWGGGGVSEKKVGSGLSNLKGRKLLEIVRESFTENKRRVGEKRLLF